MKMRGFIPLLCIVTIATLQGCRKQATPTGDPLLQAYDQEADWNDATHVISLNFEQAQGKRVFYTYCVWCHADSTPAGPSNRANVKPDPPLMNDGTILNSPSDDDLRNVITFGGAAVGKSPMMPPYGQTLTAAEIRGVIAFTREIAQPSYHAPAHAGLQ